MSEPSWRIDPLEQEPLAVGPSAPVLVTLHFLLTALKRRWRVWVGLGCVGMLLGLTWTLVSPPKSVGTVSLMLAHETSVDPQQAMSTNVSLLRTRTLAAAVVDELGLDMTPEEFQETVTGVPDSTDVLVLEVTGPNDTSAVERTRALGDAYLAFRASQIRSQTEALTRGYQERLTVLRAELKELRKQYDALSTTAVGDAQALSALVTEQGQVSTEIETIERSIRDASLKANSIIDASNVLDPAADKPQASRLKPLALAMVSGLIGATAVGVGLVLTTALLSGRLRLREEVALALDAPVRLSVGPLRARRSWWPFRSRQESAAALPLLVDALDQQVARPSRKRQPPPTRLALACVDNAEDGWQVIQDLATRLTLQGIAVFVLDLSTAGDLEAALAGVALADEDVPASRRRPVVHRPDRVPSLLPGPGGTATSTAADPSVADARDEAWRQADVVLALVEVDPAVGLEHLAAWVDDVVVLVTAGRSSAERLRTTGELIRAAGLRLPFALMVGADRTDESLGLPTADPQWGNQARISR